METNCLSRQYKSQARARGVRVVAAEEDYCAVYTVSIRQCARARAVIKYFSFGFTTAYIADITALAEALSLRILSPRGARRETVARFMVSDYRQSATISLHTSGIRRFLITCNKFTVSFSRARAGSLALSRLCCNVARETL